MYDDMDPTGSKNKLAVLAIALFALFVIYTLSSDCRICTVMQNPPDWIDSWYDGPDRWNTPEKGPAG